MTYKFMISDLHSLLMLMIFSQFFLFFQSCEQIGCMDTHIQITGVKRKITERTLSCRKDSDLFHSIQRERTRTSG